MGEVGGRASGQASRRAGSGQAGRWRGEGGCLTDADVALGEEDAHDRGGELGGGAARRHESGARDVLLQAGMEGCVEEWVGGMARCGGRAGGRRQGGGGGAGGRADLELEVVDDGL